MNAKPPALDAYLARAKVIDGLLARGFVVDTANRIVAIAEVVK